MKDSFYVPDNRQYIKILLAEIQYIEAVKKYVKIFTAAAPCLVSVSLCYAEQRLPPDMFCRIHKSYIISLLYTKKFDSESVYLPGKILPIGKHYKDILLQRVDIWGKDVKDQGSFSDNVIDKLVGKL